MRMWMIEPEKLCRQHLLGEHNEIHKAIGNLNHSGKWARALIKKGYLEPNKFQSRHDQLVQEMLHRGYNHNSPLDANGFTKLKGKVNRIKSKRDLKARCKNCFQEDRNG